MTSFSFLLFRYELTYVTVSWLQLFSLNNFFLFNYSLVSFIFTVWQHQNPYLKQSLSSPCGNTRSWSRHQICDTSSFLFILKFLQLVKLFYVIRFEFLKLVVSTSSVLWSQVRWFFVLE